MLKLLVLLIGVFVVVGVVSVLFAHIKAWRAMRAVEQACDAFDGDPDDDDDEFMSKKAMPRAALKARKRAMPKALRAHFSRYGETTQYVRGHFHAEAG